MEMRIGCVEDLVWLPGNLYIPPMEYSFSSEQRCPSCQAVFSKAEQKKEHDPVIVVVCPKCGTMLWRPGFDEDSPLVVFEATDEVI